MRRYTLIEILIASALFALLALCCVNLLNATTSSLEAQISRSAHLIELERIEQVFHKIFANAVQLHPATDKPSQDSSFLEQKYDEHELSLIARHRVNDIETGGLRFYHLFLGSDASLHLDYRDNPLGPLQSTLLAQELANIELHYARLDSKGGITWSEKLSPPSVPDAVKLTLTWKAGQQEIFLYRLNGSSQYRSLVSRHRSSLP